MVKTNLFFIDSVPYLFGLIIIKYYIPHSYAPKIDAYERIFYVFIGKGR